MAKKKPKPPQRASSKAKKKTPSLRSAKKASEKSTNRLVKALDSFSQDEDWDELDPLAKQVSKVKPTTELMDAILRIFERYPETGDDFVYLGSILEEMPGYEKRLVRSVKRTPSISGLRKINQLLNSDVAAVGMTNLIELLSAVASSEKTDIGIREEAENYLKHQGALKKGATLIKATKSASAKAKSRTVAAEELFPLLGKNYDSPEFKQLGKRLNEKGSPTRIDTSCYLSYRNAGISFHAEHDRNATTIFVYLVADDRYQAFGGKLPRGLLAGDSQAKVRKRLGKPTKTGGGGTVPVLGKMPIWDCYENDSYSLMIHYNEGKSAIQQITISPLKADE